MSGDQARLTTLDGLKEVVGNLGTVVAALGQWRESTTGGYPEQIAALVVVDLIGEVIKAGGEVGLVGKQAVVTQLVTPLLRLQPGE